MSKDSFKLIANNKKAYHDYFIEDKFEAGISLVGTEVKSVKLGRINLKDSYAEEKNGSVFLRGVHISPYENGNIFNRDPLRDRRLLLHKNEILKLKQYSQKDGMTLVPLSVYIQLVWWKTVYTTTLSFNNLHTYFNMYIHIH